MGFLIKLHYFKIGIKKKKKTQWILKKNLTDDLPKPSPRNKKSKGPAAASLAKLSEPKNLKVSIHSQSNLLYGN